MLFLLRRCVAVKQLPVPSGIQTGGGGGFVQQRTWSSATRTVGRIQASVAASRYRLCTKVRVTPEREPSWSLGDVIDVLMMTYKLRFM